jgi:ABC-type sulfate transport system permease component
MSTLNRRILPGFRLSLSYSLTYLTILVLIPIAACFAKASTLPWETFWATIWTERARAACLLTFGSSFAAAVVNIALGLLIAWVLVRYEFPLKGTSSGDVIWRLGPRGGGLDEDHVNGRVAMAHSPEVNAQ